MGTEDAEPSGKRRIVPLRHIDLRSCKRKHIAMILQHDHRFDLCLVAGLHEPGIAHDFRGGGRIDVRVLEEARAEHVHQQPDRRLFETVAGCVFPEFFTPHLVGF